MRKSKGVSLSSSLSELVRKFSKNDVIAEMEKEYQSVAAKNIPLFQIDDNSFIKRVPMPFEAVDRIYKSIGEKGLFNPLVVRPSGSHYELVLGRKRYYAAKKAGLKEVPAVIKEVGDEETLLMLLADTRDQREANIVEMALVYEELAERFGYSQATLADLSHQSRSQVTNTMRILRLPDHIIDEISEGKLSYGHAKAIVSLSDEEIEETVRLIHQEKLSVRQTEEFAKQYSKLPPSRDSETDGLKKAANAVSVLVKKTSVTFVFLSEQDKADFLDKVRKKL